MAAAAQILDHLGQRIEPGSVVRIRSVTSCASGLPEDDQARLASLVGHRRPVAEIERDGFVWLSFDEGIRRSDFCLMPIEVEVE